MSATNPPSTPLRCLCGAAAPEQLGEPGEAPLRCATCRTPLVRPGPVADWRTQRAYGAAILAAVVSAMSWMLLSIWTGTGAPFVVAIAGGLVGMAARSAARARGGAVQTAALVAFVIFLALGETLLFQRALHPRLVALHELEGAAEPEIEARQELELMRRMPFVDRLELYGRIESSLGLFLSIGFGAAGALLITRAPAALAALAVPRRDDDATTDPVVPDHPAEDEPDARPA